MGLDPDLNKPTKYIHMPVYTQTENQVIWIAYLYVHIYF